MTTPTLDAKRLERIQAMYADELAGGTLFRGLAEHADDQRRSVFLQLADAEERHAEHWSRLLRQAGVEPRRPRVPFRVKALCFLARHFGTEAVLPLMLRTEAAEADRYRDEAEATDTMAQQEAAAGRTIAAMQGIPAGGRIARSEGRHRAGIGGALRAIVFGMNDGLVSNFSLVMGVAGGTHDKSIVVLAGVAGLVAGAFSMASGEWISIRSQRELYQNELRIEREELRAFPEEERDELELIYQAKGIAPEAARSLVDSIMRRSDVALDTLGARRARSRSHEARLAMDRRDLVVPRVRVGRRRPAHPVPGRQRYRRHRRRRDRVGARVVRGRRGDVDLHRPPRRPVGAADGPHRRRGRNHHLLHRQSGRHDAVVPASGRAAVRLRCPRRGRGSRSPRRGTQCPRRATTGPSRR